MRRVEEIWKETREEILEKLLKDSNLQVPICQFQSSDADSFREHHLSDIPMLGIGSNQVGQSELELHP